MAESQGTVKRAERPAWMTTLTEGECYMFTDTTSMMFVGRVLRIKGPHTVDLDEAAWVAETGGVGTRLSEFLRDGRCNGMEIEPVGFRGDLHHCGWYAWPHPLFPEAV